MGRLSTEIKKAMAEKRIKQIDFDELTGGVVTQSTIAQILRGAIPKKPGKIDIIAETLGRDKKEFRRIAAQDIIDRELRSFGFKIQDVYKGKEDRTEYKLPLYQYEELQKCLSKQGYPISEPSSHIMVPVAYGKYAYALAVKDTVLFPRVFPGEIVIISQDYKLNSVEDYGLIGYDKKLYIGRVREHAQYLILDSFTPYRAELILKKKIAFAHKIVGIYRKPQLAGSMGSLHS